jgi:hypothetical protein
MPPAVSHKEFSLDERWRVGAIRAHQADTTGDRTGVLRRICQYAAGANQLACGNGGDSPIDVITWLPRVYLSCLAAGLNLD